MDKIDARLYEVRPNRSIWIGKYVAKPSKVATVVFIHGSCASYSQFNAIIQWAIDTAVLDVVYYDYLGCGQSDKQAPKHQKWYFPSEHWEDLVAIIDQHCDEQVPLWVVGHSFGCLMALRLATESKWSSRVQKMVLMGCPSIFQSNPMPWVLTLPCFMLKWMQPWLTNAFVHRAFSPDTIANNAQLVEASKRISNANPPHMFQNFYKGVSEESPAWKSSLQSKVKSLVDLLVLFMNGDSDQIVDPGSSIETAGAFPCSSIVTILKASHQMMEEQPEQVIDHLQAYFALS